MFIDSRKTLADVAVRFVAVQPTEASQVPTDVETTCTDPAPFLWL
jgi:hypothetical protein